jgi:hypothetical protein
MIVCRILPLCLLFASASAASAPVVTASVSALTFSAFAGSESAPQKVTFTNTGSQPVEVHGAAIRTADDSLFAVRDDCPSTLESTQYCTAVVIFKPAHPGAVTATLEFADNTVSVSATALAARP